MSKRSKIFHNDMNKQTLFLLSCPISASFMWHVDAVHLNARNALISDSGGRQASGLADLQAQYSHATELFGKEDYSKAAELFCKAAEQGLADAQFLLGSLYADGEGVEKDMNQATAWYRKSAEQGGRSGTVQP